MAPSDRSQTARASSFGRSAPDRANSSAKNFSMMLKFEHIGKQLILAAEVMIERALGELRRFSDVVHGDAAVPVSTKQLVGCI